MGALSFGLGMGALSLASGLASGAAKSSQQKAQAAQMEAQAEALGRQADAAREQSERNAYAADARKSQIRRQFRDVMGRNASLLGAGNVDMATGSAADTALGNINRFAADMGENSYDRALRLWEGRQAEQAHDYQAEAARAQASYLRRTAGNFGTSLLTATLGAVPAAVSGYTLAGGKVGGLFGSSPAAGGISAISGGQANWLARPSPSLLSIALGK